MLTCELIGGIKATWGWFGQDVDLIMQPASIKKPTVAIARARKYKSTARRLKAGPHAVDAETHGYFYIHQREKQKAGT